MSWGSLSLAPSPSRVPFPAAFSSLSPVSSSCSSISSSSSSDMAFGSSLSCVSTGSTIDELPPHLLPCVRQASVLHRSARLSSLLRDAQYARTGPSVLSLGSFEEHLKTFRRGTSSCRRAMLKGPSWPKFFLSLSNPTTSVMGVSVRVFMSPDPHSTHSSKVPSRISCSWSTRLSRRSMRPITAYTLYSCSSESTSPSASSSKRSTDGLLTSSARRARLAAWDVPSEGGACEVSSTRRLLLRTRRHSAVRCTHCWRCWKLALFQRSTAWRSGSSSVSFQTNFGSWR
mmetsp:Transcript_24421/g.44199  ORF Transcript_24421/g.44199 Transcript_24421/m.44199 type:complete len:286 (+) Transcript_24421:3036-3893(+)